MKFVKLAKIWYFGRFPCAIYYINVTKFVKLAKFGLFTDFRGLYYIKGKKFDTHAYIGIFENFRVLHKSHEVR